MNDVKYPVKVMLSKSKDMRFFSQLDLFRLLERALRRSGLPVYFTQGFNPRVKISFVSALKLGIEGQIEATFYFTEYVSPATLKEKMGPQLAEGLEINE